MFKALCEVIKDLWRFAFNIQEGQTNQKKPAGRPPELDEVPEKDGQDRTPRPPLDPRSYGRLAYVTKDETYCLAEPILKFDTKVATLFYGEEVAVTELKKNFARIAKSDCEGWVKASDLSDDRSRVFPNFAPGYVYGSDHQETIKLRRLLRDEALGHQLQLPLQPLEFVLFKLKEAGIKLDWPPERPREPGAWQALLRGATGVKMSIYPRTGAVLEYAGNGTPGFLGYIESVAPDQSISLASVGRVEAGEYRVEQFTSTEWKEWRPTFISFA